VPLTTLPWPAADAVFTVFLLLITVGSAWLILRHLGWRGRPLGLGLFVVTLSPVVFISLFLGQATPLVFAAFAGALMLANRHPWPAGLLLALVWIKPNLGLVLPVVVLLQTGAWRRLLMALGVGTLAMFAIAGALLGSGLAQWPRGILQLWRSVQGPQPDVASLHSFYYPLLGGWMKTAALVLVCLALGAYGLWAVRRLPARPMVGMTLLVIWLCAVPFVHSFDAILLVPVVAILVEPTLRGLDDPWVELAIWAFALCPLLYFTGLHLGPLNGFGAIPVALTAWAWHRRIVAPAPPAMEAAA
jgi:hypothetical protein